MRNGTLVGIRHLSPSHYIIIIVMIIKVKDDFSL